NLSLLREQLNYIEDEDIEEMHDAVYTKYLMFKKFKGAMHIVAIAEISIFIHMDSSVESYWMKLLVREWAHFCIFLYIGSQDLAPRFSVMPTHKYKRERIVPPIYSIELDAASFKDFSSREWQIGVPTWEDRSSNESILVVIQHPHASRPVLFKPGSEVPATEAISCLKAGV
ncbi:hypothetical protein M8C21_009198, partial [Ambrosia artemisiifolia]